MKNSAPELIEKAKEAKSAEEILALAKENKVEITEEQAKAVYAQLHPVSGELSDDELDNVSGGGCGGSTDEERFHSGERVFSYYSCPKCGCNYAVFDYIGSYGSGCMWWVKCESCGTQIASNISYDAEMTITDMKDVIRKI